MKILFVNIVIFSVVFVSFLGCQYTTPFSAGKDLISVLDLSTDWIIEDGLILDQTTETPPSSETQTYFLHFLNLVAYDTFESSTTTNDIGTWQKSSPDLPSICSVESGSQLYGSKYLHLSLKRDFGAETLYHTFSAEGGKNYIFKFYYVHQGGGNIQLSLGENTTDTQYKDIAYTGEGIEYAQWDFYSPTSVINMQIRFGYGDVTTPGAINYEIFVDNIALFLQSNHNISKKLNIVGSDVTDLSNDGTGEKFYEGVYKFTIYAKKGSSQYLTLRLGNNYKTYTLTSEWTEYLIEDHISIDYDYLNLEIMPTKTNEKERFPGGIYITKPHLYFLPNQKEPVEH